MQALDRQKFFSEGLSGACVGLVYQVYPPALQLTRGRGGSSMLDPGRHFSITAVTPQMMSRRPCPRRAPPERFTSYLSQPFISCCCLSERVKFSRDSPRPLLSPRGTVQNHRLCVGHCCGSSLSAPGAVPRRVCEARRIHDPGIEPQESALLARLD